MDHFKAFIKFVTTLFLFNVLVFGSEACEILAPQPGMEPSPPTTEGGVPTTEWLGSATLLFNESCFYLLQLLYYNFKAADKIPNFITIKI